MRHHCPSRINAGSRRNISSSPGIAACKMEGTATISQRRAAESGNSPKTRRLFNHTSISATEAATTAKISTASKPPVPEVVTARPYIGPIPTSGNLTPGKAHDSGGERFAAAAIRSSVAVSAIRTCLLPLGP